MVLMASSTGSTGEGGIWMCGGGASWASPDTSPFWASSRAVPSERRMNRRGNRGDMAIKRLFFRQGLIFGFGQEREHEEAGEQHEGNPTAGRAEALDVAAEPAGQLADG